MAKSRMQSGINSRWSQQRSRWWISFMIFSALALLVAILMQNGILFTSILQRFGSYVILFVKSLLVGFFSWMRMPPSHSAVRMWAWSASASIPSAVTTTRCADPSYFHSVSVPANLKEQPALYQVYELGSLQDRQDSGWYCTVWKSCDLATSPGAQHGPQRVAATGATRQDLVASQGLIVGHPASTQAVSSVTVFKIKTN